MSLPVRDEEIIEQANCAPTNYIMDLGFPNKQQQQQGLAFLFTLRYLWQWFSKEQSHFSFGAFYEYELFSHRSGSYPNTKCQRKWKTKHFKSSIQKKENISFFLNRSQRLSPSFGRLCQPRCQGQKERQEIQRRSTQSDCLLSFLPCTSTCLHLCRRWRRMWGWKRELTEVDVLIYDNNSGIVNSSFYQRL